MGAQYFYTVVCLAAFGAFLGSTVMGWSSPMLEKLKELDDNPLGRKITKTENSWLASLPILSSGIGCLLLSIVGNKLGRKTILLSGGVIVLTFYLVMTWAQAVWLLIMGRFMTGLGVGLILSTLPLFFGEMAEAKNRGLISTFLVIFMNGGMLFTSIAGPYFSFFSFHITLACLAAFFTVSFFFFGTETPYYAIRSDRSKAENILRRIRGDQNFDETLNQMEESLHNSSKASFIEILNSRASRKTLLIGVGGFTFYLFTGNSIIISYSQTILKEAGVGFPPENGPIIINVIQFITSLILSSVADRFPRKFLLAISHAGISLSQIPLGIYFHLKYNDYDLDSISWLPLICMVTFSVMFSIGVGPILMTFLGELFPPKTKSVVVPWLIAYNLSTSFLITFLYNDLEDSLGKANLLFISAAFGFAAVIFVRFCMIETKGKTLQEIQDELNSE